MGSLARLATEEDTLAELPRLDHDDEASYGDDGHRELPSDDRVLHDDSVESRDVCSGARVSAEPGHQAWTVELDRTRGVKRRRKLTDEREDGEEASHHGPEEEAVVPGVARELGVGTGGGIEGQPVNHPNWWRSTHVGVLGFILKKERRVSMTSKARRRQIQVMQPAQEMIQLLQVRRVREKLKSLQKVAERARNTSSPP